METSEALHWTRQQQKIDLDPEQQLYTPKIENTAVIEICMKTSEALHWTQEQQKIDMDPEHQLYTVPPIRARHQVRYLTFILKELIGNYAGYVAIATR
ncbi:hypothetical protein LAZ67_1002820 [Cordylochernes scorpioides]|uniref:Uncharacterized protein n=1 Tax=Cordylochernes scorpioides TaxID=51811 RepID=A0ABY6JZU1_9ARAC|nr:hypothetical protein LAZ67_1002820 [Cordylochernes scorpioides]